MALEGQEVAETMPAQGKGFVNSGGASQPAAPESRDAAEPAKELIPPSPEEKDPDVMAAIESEIDNIAKAHERIEVINHYFMNR